MWNMGGKIIMKPFVFTGSYPHLVFKHMLMAPSSDCLAGNFHSRTVIAVILNAAFFSPRSLLTTYAVDEEFCNSKSISG